MTIEISAKTVKELRERTSAGMMDCKKALQECNGDFEKAVETLKQKGLVSAAKKAARVATEGIIESYIHMGGKLGILVELNCETDFVARRPEFQELAKNIAMQIAACPNVDYIKTSDIPNEIIQKEKETEMNKNDLDNKPTEIKEKIVEGRIQKRLKELSLMDQSYIRDSSILIEELIKENIAKLGENIQIRRFERFTLGEGLEKREDNFNEEVNKMLTK
ncbi:elongation factor Ts (chloroplast) [Guillardia theta]|uniref:Elongation factor Ts, chloroplastic n=2 Tax=Guillardia theta TaxID=55529 RepID=EFTS_GUITH|nr:elongation factor Ts [Guillardia theta]O78481.1 RecName: Full=Elongation factor Ts, chloroplastic; Short=EF-Ts [Guillardia theta]AAC35672.1 elongation factor Ts [Guillardia theta]